MSGSGVNGPVRTLTDGIGMTGDGTCVGVAAGAGEALGVGVDVARTIGLLNTTPK